MTGSQIIKNIVAALMNKGINTPTALAKSVNYDQGNMSRICTDKKKIPAILRERLHLKYAIRHDYMLTGEGEIFEDKGPSVVPMPMEQVLEQAIRLNRELSRKKINKNYKELLNTSLQMN